MTSKKFKISGSGDSVIKEFFKKITSKNSKEKTHLKKPIIKNNPKFKIKNRKAVNKSRSKFEIFSTWEQQVVTKLQDEQIEFETKHRRFPIKIDDIDYIYSPDFILRDILLKEKKILIEAHEELLDEDIKKFRKFMDVYGRMYHLIVIVKCEELRKWNKFDSGEQAMFHEIWLYDDLNDLIKYLKKISEDYQKKINSLSSKTICPLPNGCGVESIGYENIQRVFGYRKMKNGVIIPQSYCRTCRSGKPRYIPDEDEHGGGSYSRTDPVGCIGCGIKFIQKSIEQIYCDSCHSKL